MKIIDKQIVAFGDQYILEVHFDEDFDSSWISSYKEGLHEMSQLSTWNSLGGPTIDKVDFRGKCLSSKPFPEMAQGEIKPFLNELDEAVSAMIQVHDRMLARQKQEDEREQQLEEEKQRKLKKLNDLLK
jgi:hypothetical protein